LVLQRQRVILRLDFLVAHRADAPHRSAEIADAKPRETDDQEPEQDPHDDVRHLGLAALRHAGRSPETFLRRS